MVQNNKYLSTILLFTLVMNYITPATPVWSATAQGTESQKAEFNQLETHLLARRLAGRRFSFSRAGHRHFSEHKKSYRRTRNVTHQGYMSSSSNFSRPQLEIRDKKPHKIPEKNYNEKNINWKNLQQARNSAGGYMVPAYKSDIKHQINIGNLNSEKLHELRENYSGIKEKLPENIKNNITENKPFKDNNHRFINKNNINKHIDVNNIHRDVNRTVNLDPHYHPPHPAPKPPHHHSGYRPPIHPRNPYIIPPHPVHMPYYHYNHYMRGAYYWGFWNGYNYKYPWEVALTTALVTLPATAMAISIASKPDVKYYYNEGVYYINDGNQYKVTQPPAGIVVNSLPEGMMPINVEGKSYYYYFGTFYTMDPEDHYQVVDAPYGAIVPYVPQGAKELDFDNGTVLVKALNTYYKPTKDGDNTVFLVVNPSNY